MPPGRRNRCISATGALSGCQIPERSGLPLSRGTGADKFGLPSRVRGTVGSRYTAHWALTYRGAATSAINNHASRFLNGPSQDALVVKLWNNFALQSRGLIVLDLSYLKWNASVSLSVLFSSVESSWSTCRK